MIANNKFFASVVVWLEQMAKVHLQQNSISKRALDIKKK